MIGREHSRATFKHPGKWWHKPASRSRRVIRGILGRKRHLQTVSASPTQPGDFPPDYWTSGQ